MNFETSDIRVLVVDDNKMNLALAGKVMSSLGICVDCAESGEKALDLLEETFYHIVFMDCLMPEMDGLETTERIRQKEDTYYKEIPIIALTGEDMADMERFRQAGMNDYMAKPLERTQLEKILQKWLPADKEIMPMQISGKEQPCRGMEHGVLDIKGIDVEAGIRISGSYEAFYSFLGDFYKLIEAKAHLLECYLADGRLKEYMIEVHALKNSARIIGAMELSQYFQQLEHLAKAGDAEKVEEKTPELLIRYREFKEILEPFAVKGTACSKEASVEDILFCLRGMREAMEAFDIDSVDMAMEQLEEFCLPDKCKDIMERLRVAVADVAMETVLVLTEEMIIVLGE